MPHYLLDINCGIVIRVTAERETWVVEATCGHLEVAKKQTPNPSRESIEGGERWSGEAKLRQWSVKILAHQMSCRQGGREGKFERARICEGGACCWKCSLNNYIVACVILKLVPQLFMLLVEL